LHVTNGIPARSSLSQALTFAYKTESVLAQAIYFSLLENRVQDQSRWHAKSGVGNDLVLPQMPLWVLLFAS
jgi:hypothetical protein